MILLYVCYRDLHPAQSVTESTTRTAAFGEGHLVHQRICHRLVALHHLAPNVLSVEE
jgi:hypothetical protein